MPEVRDHEPRMALDGDEDGLVISHLWHQIHQLRGGNIGGIGRNQVKASLNLRKEV